MEILTEHTSRAIGLLYIGDSENEEHRILRHLLKSGYTVDSERVHSASGLKAALSSRPWDLAICDCGMTSFTAPEALAILRESGHDVPLLALAAAAEDFAATEDFAASEDFASVMLRAGASDYVMKDDLTGLTVAVERELREAASRAERNESRRRLRDSEARLALALDSTGTGVFDFNPVTGALVWCGRARAALGVSPVQEPSYEAFLQVVHPEDRNYVEREVSRSLQSGGEGIYSAEYRTAPSATGEVRWLSGSGRTLYDEHGRAVRFVGVVRDITETKRAEQALQYQLQLNACLTENSTDPIMQIGVDGRVGFINREARRVFGFTLEEYQAKSPCELLRHMDIVAFPELLQTCPMYQAVISGQVVHEMEVVLFTKDGAAVDVAISVAPLALGGRAMGSVFTLNVITEQKRAERELRRIDERFRRLFDSNIIGIFITDHTRILETNDYFLRVLGYSREELTASGMTWMSLTPPELLPTCSLAFESLDKTGVCPAFEKAYIHKNGARVPVLIAGVDLTAADEGRFLWFVVDLTEQKNLEAQFRQAQKLESIGQLAGGVAHDFNNLLTVMIGYSEMALETLHSRHPLRPAMERIAAAAGKASDLTRQLLTFSRMNNGAPEFLLLDTLVIGVEQMLRRLIGEEIEVLLLPGAHDGYIHADPTLIEQAILNLVVNSRDAMPDGGKLIIETAWVAPEAAEQDPSCWLSISVTDTGCGMTPEIQARVYEPFFTTKEQGKGTGLGLSAVYGIVKQSGGRVTFTSAPGVGTSFRILLPAAQELQAGPDSGPFDSQDAAAGSRQAAGSSHLVAETY